jgi:hypothetical protein
VPGAVDVIGTANPGATVTINGHTAARHTPYGSNSNEDGVTIVQIGADAKARTKKYKVLLSVFSQLTGQIQGTGNWKAGFLHASHSGPVDKPFQIGLSVSTIRRADGQRAV